MKRNQLSEKLKAWQTQVVELRQKGFQDALNWPAGIISEFFFVRANLDTYEPAVPKGYLDRIQDLESNWIEKQKTFDQIMNTEVRAFNELFKQKNLPLLNVVKKGEVKP